MDAMIAMTPGLRKAITPRGERGTHTCGFVMPKYKGRYPAKCPLCKEPWDGTPVEVPQPEDQASDDNDEDRSTTSDSDSDTAA